MLSDHLVVLNETKSSCPFPEASPADVEAILTDDTAALSADTA